MKSITSKKMFLTTMLISSSTILLAGNGSDGMPISDTMIFSLLVALAVVFMIIIFSQITALQGILGNKDLWARKAKKQDSNASKGAGVIILAMFFGQGLYAQTGDAEAPFRITSELFWILIGLDTFLLVIIIMLNFATQGLINAAQGDEPTGEGVNLITASLTDAVPIERESEILMDHDYDGIHELDNNLPPWWKYGFYLTIVFAIIYMIRFHVIGSAPLQDEEYNIEMAAAEVEIAAYKATQADVVDEGNLVALTEAGRLEAGKKVFMDNCKICHGEFGEGLIGPNFTDKYWKNGGGIKNIYNTIKVGVPDKGMIPWENQLTAGQRHEVSSYILTLEGTNPLNQKAAEGDLGEGNEAPSTPPTEIDTLMEEEVVVEANEEVKT